MLDYLQKIGKSLMVPVAVLPAAAILLGIGYWIDPVGWGASNPLAAFFIKAGGAIIDNMPILFAIGVSFGMSNDRNGAAALAGVVAFLVVTTLLSPNTVKLEGKHFKSHVKEGEKVGVGTLLIEFEKEKIEKDYDITSPIIISNFNELKECVKTEPREVSAGEVIMTIIK